MTEITKETLISEALNVNILAQIIFERHGMGCAQCSMRYEETLEVGAKLHNVDIEALLHDLNKLVK